MWVQNAIDNHALLIYGGRGTVLITNNMNKK